MRTGEAARARAFIWLEDGAGPSELAGVLRALGLAPRPGPAWRRHGALLCAAAAGPITRRGLNALRGLPGVRAAAALGGEDRLYARAPGRKGAVVLPGGARIGGAGLAVIAGPCSVESRAQIFAAARAARAAGAAALRGGCFKPRSSPYSFGGLGEAGLALLAEARRRTGLPVVTEALCEAQLDAVAASADLIQIGSRNMHNFPLLFAAGSHPAGKPLLLKRGFGATVAELLEAAEYALLGRVAAGRPPGGVILCERGIRTFEPSLRFTLDVGAIPVLKETTFLPVIADPSHAAGARRFVLPLARAAAAAGADGLLVEMHPRPERAWSDGAQSLSFTEFRALMRALGAYPDNRPSAGRFRFAARS